jgi:hypothetical protein
MKLGHNSVLSLLLAAAMRTAALKLPIDLLYNHNRKGYERNLELGERLDSLAGAGKYSEDIEPDLMQKIG